jgi:hypothetical protein
MPLMLWEALFSQRLTRATAQRLLTCLQALSPRERQAAERVLGALLYMPPTLNSRH